MRGYLQGPLGPLQDLLQTLPLMPADSATKWSEGIVFGGSGHQLGAQLMWLIFNLMWSLLLVVPVALILRSLGILMDHRELRIAGASITVLHLQPGILSCQLLLEHFTTMCGM